MVQGTRDPSLDTLLDLDGQVFFVDPHGRYWVRFVAKRIEPTADRPHGLSYSLTLHDETGKRLIGYDNAHQVRSSAGPGGRASASRDHKHDVSTVKPYAYRDAASLLADFWTDVDRVLKERGVLE